MNRRLTSRNNWKITTQSFWRECRVKFTAVTHGNWHSCLAPEVVHNQMQIRECGKCINVRDFFCFFSNAERLHVCSKPLLPCKRQGGCFRDILKHLRKNFTAVSIRVKQHCGFFDNKTRTILVKHPFPLSHLRALPILLLKGMTIHNSHLKFALNSSGTWKQEAKLKI